MNPGHYRTANVLDDAHLRVATEAPLEVEHLMALAQSLAHQFYAMSGNKAAPDHNFRESSHPLEKLMWEQGCLAVGCLRSTDMEDVCMQYDDDSE